MGEVASLAQARAQRARQQDGERQAKVHAEIVAAIERGEGCPWTEDEMVEGWSKHVRGAWYPRRGIKRGCIKRVMRRAYAGGDCGINWLKPCPLNLICEALPDPWGEQNLQAATYLTMLLYDYLWRIGAISGADKGFCFAETRRAEAHILEIAQRDGVIPRPEPLCAVRRRKSR